MSNILHQPHSLTAQEGPSGATLALLLDISTLSDSETSSLCT